MENEFKAGDKVRVIKGEGKLLPQNSEWFVKDVNSEYLVLEDHPSSNGQGGWYCNRFIKIEDSAPDMVHSPNHYAVFDGVEAIEIIAKSLTVEEFRGYCFGNLLKYRLRCGKKDDIQQELAKADKYKELFEKYKHFCRSN